MKHLDNRDLDPPEPRVRILLAIETMKARGNRGSACLLRRIKERDVTEQREIGLVCDGVRCLRWRHLLGDDGDYPKSVRVELGCSLDRRSEMALIEGTGLVADRVVLANREDLRIDQGERLIDRRGRGHRLASEVGQHVFNHYKNQHFTLDNEDPADQKATYPSRAPFGKGISIAD